LVKKDGFIDKTHPQYLNVILDNGVLVVESKCLHCSRLTDIFFNNWREFALGKTISSMNVIISDTAAVPQLLNLLRLYPELKNAVLVRSPIPRVIACLVDGSKKHKMGVQIRKQMPAA
jgi:hypothetical protein